MQITYVGHSTVLLETGGMRFLTDPLLRSRVGHLRRHGLPPSPLVAERIDAVLLSHLHADHFDRPSLRRVTGRTAIVAPKGAAGMVRRSGHRVVHELRPGESVEVRTIATPSPSRSALIRATRAQHGGRRRPFGPEAEAVGYLIEIDGRRIYFAGDTELFDEMAELAGSEAAPLDVALLPISGWGPSLGPGHMGPEDAARATGILRPRVVVPIHWGTLFPIGLGRRGVRHLRNPPLDFAALVAEQVPGTEVKVLEPGRSFQLASPDGASGPSANSR